MQGCSRDQHRNDWRCAETPSRDPPPPPQGRSLHNGLAVPPPPVPSPAGPLRPGSSAGPRTRARPRPPGRPPRARAPPTGRRGPRGGGAGRPPTPKGPTTPPAPPAPAAPGGPGGTPGGPPAHAPAAAVPTAPAGVGQAGGNAGTSDACEGKGPPGRLDRRLEGVAKAVGGGYCRLQMPVSLGLGIRGTVARRRLGALDGGVPPTPFQCIPAWDPWRPLWKGMWSVDLWGGPP